MWHQDVNIIHSILLQINYLHFKFSGFYMLISINILIVLCL